ncbi:MAG: hypothetical protein ACYCYI_09155 [Saccharofermentanales bacterium]
MIKCASCHAENVENSSFCNQCGKRIEKDNLVNNSTINDEKHKVIDYIGINYHLIKNDTSLVFKNSKNEFICESSFENITILYYNKKDALGTGHMTMHIANINKTITVSFDNNQCNIFYTLHDFLTEHCESIDSLTILEAANYMKTPKEKARDEKRTDNFKNAIIMRKNKKIRIGAKKKKETQCTCGNCSNEWYVDDEQIMRYAANLMLGAGSVLLGHPILGSYNINKATDVFQCPRCRSKKIKKKEIVFWVDTNGNYVD